jgi:sugar phosphate isomerase/epimerase
MTTRRSLLTASAALAFPALAPANKLKTFGVQLYTVRSVIDAGPARVLGALAAAGYAEAEVVSGNMEKIWSALTATKLKPVSVHLPTEHFTTQQEKLGPALDDVKKRGFRYAVCPYIAPKDRGGVDVIRKLAATLNQAGETCRAQGLTLAYHNHAFEFAPAEGGKTLLDVLLAETDPKNVVLELDMFWAAVAGLDPVDVLRKYGKRVALLHLKDKAPGLEQRFNESVPRTAFKEIGAGDIDFKKVLHAAGEAGVKHYFVEQDQTPADPIASLKQSASYLKGLDF